MKEEKTRTPIQNRSIHKLFTMMANEFNEKGLDMKVVLKPEWQIWWTPEAVKEYLWRPIMKTMYAKDSTKNINTDEVSKIYEVIMKNLGEKFGVYLPFPSKEELDDYINSYNSLI